MRVTGNLANSRFDLALRDSSLPKFAGIHTILQWFPWRPCGNFEFDLFGTQPSEIRTGGPAGSGNQLPGCRAGERIECLYAVPVETALRRNEHAAISLYTHRLNHSSINCCARAGKLCGPGKVYVVNRSGFPMAW
jgi:hypothetical protein